MKHKTLWLLGILMFIGSSLFARELPKPGINLYSLRDDISLGREVVRKFETTVRVVHEYQRWNLDEIGAKLATVVPEHHYRFPHYSFRVVENKSLNAFAIPGGFIYVTTGMLEFVKSESELAAVMAHEMTHVNMRHTTNSLTKRDIFQGIFRGLSYAAGEKKKTSVAFGYASLASTIGFNFFDLKWGRKQEKQADLTAVYMLARAGYDPLAVSRFFERLNQRSKKGSGIPGWMRSHPKTDKRALYTAQFASELQK